MKCNGLHVVHPPTHSSIHPFIILSWFLSPKQVPGTGDMVSKISIVPPNIVYILVLETDNQELTIQRMLNNDYMEAVGLAVASILIKLFN